MKKALFFLLITLTASGCSGPGGTMKTVQAVELNRFMGDWYVLAGRFTFLEKDVHNGLETYTWNQGKERIDIAFTYNQGSLDGPKKSLPQKAWVQDKQTNAHWKVSPLWPFKFDYLIVALDKDYRWTAIGVPDQKYLWIMARDWKNPGLILEEAVMALESAGYDTKNLVVVPHQWP
jgi:apolipoprotein D and lipocalin family protein